MAAEQPNPGPTPNPIIGLAARAREAFRGPKVAKPREVTGKERNDYLFRAGSELGDLVNQIIDLHISLHPFSPDKPSHPHPISLAEIGREVTKEGPAEGHETRAQEWVNGMRSGLVERMVASRTSPGKVNNFLTFSSEDHNAILQHLLERIKTEVQSGKPAVVLSNGERVTLDIDSDWQQGWKDRYPELNSKQGFLRIGHGAERVRQSAEALFNRMGHALEGKKVFGKSISEFALHGAGTSALGMGAKELAKGIVSLSGLAGAVGGGLTGTFVTGAFVGAASGALVEYARQVNKNLDLRLNDQQLAELGNEESKLYGRKEAFLWKMKELRHREVFKPNDWIKLRNKAAFGAIAGAGAGTLVGFVPQLSEFVKGITDNLGDVGSIPSAVKDLAGNIPGGVGDMAGAAGRTIGDTAGTIGQTGGDILGAAGGIAETAIRTRGDVLGTVGRTGGDILGSVGGLTDNIPGVKGVKDIASNIQQTAGLESAPPAPEEPKVVPQEIFDATQANYDTLKENYEIVTKDLTEAHQTIDNLQQQLTEAHQALGTSKEIVPKLDEIQKNLDDMQQQLSEAKQALADAKGVIPAAGAAEAAAKAAGEQALTHAQSALDSFGGSVSLQAGSNPWEVSANILKTMGVEPTPGQIMQLDKVLSSENSIGVPDWGIKGTIDARNLPVGFKLNLTDVVKKTALEIASKK